MPWDAPVMTATFCVYMCFQSTRRSVNYRPMTFIDDWSYNCKHGTDIGCTGTDSGGRRGAFRQPLVREHRRREICAVAGVPKGSFYYFFPSKQALALEVIDQ